jgi:hypothetical protein
MRAWTVWGSFLVTMTIGLADGIQNVSQRGSLVKIRLLRQRLPRILERGARTRHHEFIYQKVTMMTKLHIARHISLRGISGRLEAMRGEFQRTENGRPAAK